MRLHSFPRRTAVLPVLLLLLPLTTACHKSPTAPTPVLSTETFTGSLEVGGTDFKPFDISYDQGASDGTVTINSLTAVADGSAVTTTIGVGFGVIGADGTCTLSSLHTASAATIGQQLFATSAFYSGQYCVEIFDAGTLTQDVTYSLTIEHY